MPSAVRPGLSAVEMLNPKRDHNINDRIRPMSSARHDDDSEPAEEALTEVGDPALADDAVDPADPAVGAASPRAGGHSASEGEEALPELEPPSRTGLARVRDPVDRFLAEARRYPRLSEADERALGTAVRDRGDMEAARRLVVHNLRLVIAIAYQYRRAWTNILDLFQEGSVGLMEAVKRWEPKLGPRFGTYAAYWIRAYVLRFLMTNSRLIHVGNTRAGRKLYYRLEKERQKLLAAGIDVTPKLLAAKLDVDEKELDEVRQHLESREIPFDPPGTQRRRRRRDLSASASGWPRPRAHPRWRRRTPS